MINEVTLTVFSHRKPEMSKENMTEAQSKSVEKLADLVSHLQLNGEFALPEGVWESNDGGIWDLLRDIYFTLLPKEFQKELLDQD